MREAQSSTGDPAVRAVAEKSLLKNGNAQAWATRGKQANAVQPQRLSGETPLGEMRQSDLYL